MAESFKKTQDSEIGIYCYICKIDFNREDRRPKVLPCGHNVCTVCVNKLVDNHAEFCPFCRQIFLCFDANDFATNMKIIKILRGEILPEILREKVDASKAKDGKYPEAVHSIRTRKKEIFQETLSYYSNIGIIISKEIQLNAEFSKKQIELTEHLMSLIDDLYDLKERRFDRATYVEKAISLMQLAEFKRKKLMKRVKDIEVESKSAGKFSSLGSFTDELQGIKKKAVAFDDNLQKFLPDLVQTRSALEKEYQKCKESVDKMSAGGIFAHLEEEDPKIAHLDLPHELAALKVTDNHVTLDDIREMKEPIKRKIKQGRIFVKHYLKEHQKQMISHLSLTGEGELLLHHLTLEESLPPDCYVIEYSEILKMVNTSSRTTFITFRGADTREGQVFFDLSPDTSGGRYCFQMCSGEIGTSYVKGGKRTFMVCNDIKTNELWFIHKPKEPKPSVCGNKYKSKKPVVLINGPDSQIADSGEVIAPGTLCGLYSKDGIFALSVTTPGDHPQGSCDAVIGKLAQLGLNEVIGKVHKGLEVLERVCSAVANSYAFTEDIITDCGIVLQIP